MTSNASAKRNITRWLRISNMQKQCGFVFTKKDWQSI